MTPIARLWLAAAALALAAPARAAVEYTGYADLRFTALSNDVDGMPAALGAAGQTAGKRMTGGFRADSIGLFGDTVLQERWNFKWDLSYRDVAQTSTVRFQYAYIEYKPVESVTLRGGRVTLPFGYYNEHLFYPFQRDQVASPVMQSAVLGLPFADWGVSATHRLALGGGAIRYSVYSVNGYGHMGANTDKLRMPNALSSANAMSNNLRSADNNHEQSLGGQLAFEAPRGLGEAGVSYYRGVWNAAGTQPLQMMNAHVKATFGAIDALWEGLRVDAKGDQGLGPALGSTDNSWTTLGHFLKVRYRDLATVGGKPLTPFLIVEDNATKGKGGGPRELLSGGGGGASLRVSDQLVLKAEYREIYYRQPFANLGAGESMRQRFKALLLAAVVTF